MCNRYVAPSEGDIERFWQIGRRDQWKGEAPIFPRRQGPFLRAVADSEAREIELAVGRWGLIPWFANTAALNYATNQARFEEIANKASYKRSWLGGRRCIIPAWSFDEPCWETGKNVWWRFRRSDGLPWGLAGLWNAWTDKATGEIHESYTMLTVNADDHPLLSRMHKPVPNVPPDRQDKRGTVSIERNEVDAWLYGSIDEAAALVRLPPVALIDGAPTNLT